MADDKARIAELERQLAAAKKTVDALVRRAERQAETDPRRFSIAKAMANLEEVIAARERQLALSEMRYGAVWDVCPDGLVTLSSDGDIRAANSAAVRMGMGTRFAAAFKEPDAAVALLDEVRPSGELVLRDGRTVHVNAARLEDDQWLVVLHDLSETQRLSRQLEDARRKASVGELAEVVAHEINNPLAVILGRLEMLREVADPEDATLSKGLDVVYDHARRIAQISRNLCVFGSPSLGEQRDLDVRALLNAAIQQGGRRLANIDVVLDVPDDLMVYGDPVQLEQVVVALLLHRADMLHRRGRVRITAAGEGALFRLEVRDQGAGIPPGLRERLHEPWSSTGSAMKGSYLGMAVASSIVQAHGGQLRALQSGPRGAVYQVVLPARRGGANGLEMLVVQSGPDGELTAQAMAAAGHRVEHVATGPLALDRLTTLTPDLILTTLYAPGLYQPMPHVFETHVPHLSSRVVLLRKPGQDVPPGMVSIELPVVESSIARLLRERIA